MPRSSNYRVRQVTELRELCTHTKCEDNVKPKWTTSTVKLFVKHWPKMLWEKIEPMIVWFAPLPTNPIWISSQVMKATIAIEPDQSPTVRSVPAFHLAPTCMCIPKCFSYLVSRSKNIHNVCITSIYRLPRLCFNLVQTSLWIHRQVTLHASLDCEISAAPLLKSLCPC